MRIQTEYLSFNNSRMISSSYDFQAHQQHSQRRCCFSQNALLWFEVLPDLLPVHPGSPRCNQSSLRFSEVFPNLSQSHPWYSSTSHQRFQLLRRLAGMPSWGLILSWNWYIQVDTPHPLRHSWRLPVTKINIADEYEIYCSDDKGNFLFSANEF